MFAFSLNVQSWGRLADVTLFRRGERRKCVWCLKCGIEVGQQQIFDHFRKTFFEVPNEWLV